MSKKPPPQVTRLAMLTVGILFFYFGARFFLVPASFGQFGWYRGNALKEIRSLPVSFAGKGACDDCHAEVVEKKEKSSHRGVPCESCHGPLNAHVENPDVAPAKIADQKFCVRCHAANPSRPEKFPQVDPFQHYDAKKNCTECHLPHQPTEAP